MIQKLLSVFQKNPPGLPRDVGNNDVAKELRQRKWSVFLAATFGYGFYYVCRLTMSVVKKPIVDSGLLDVSEIGIVGSALFFAYAVGKLVNGVLADRLNVRVFMATGLFVSACANVLLGFSATFWAFVVLWGVSGWFQSFGAACSVVSISTWYDDKQRGSFYGMWSSSHNIGEAITFIGTAIIVTSFGWRWGFWAAGLSCIVASFLIWRFLCEHPSVYGLPGGGSEASSAPTKNSLTAKQFAVFKNPVIWTLAGASAFFYVTRYAITSWGIFFLEAEKGYSTLEASAILSIGSITGIVSTFFAGLFSDQFFGGRRNAPALMFGILYVLATALFVFGPADSVIDAISMLLFGFALGALIVYVGGLMAVDLCSKDVSGTALGVIGVASYLGAGIQDIISGYLIEGGKTTTAGVATYDFEMAGWLWVGSSVISLLLAASVWNAKSID